jgi:hypothetical protein
MFFRVGLIFNARDGAAFKTSPVTRLLHEINKRTEPVRSETPVTLVPFIRTNEEAVFSLSVARSESTVEALTWAAGGVVCRSPQALLSFQHPPREPDLDFDRGMGAILSLCHVVVVACESSAEFETVTSLLALFQNVWALLALVSLRDEECRFVEIDPSLTDVEPVEWFLRVKRRWQTARPDFSALPPSKEARVGLLFPWLTSAIIRRRFENVKVRARSEIERCRGGMGISELGMEKLDPEDQVLLSRNLERLCPFFARHDDLGRYYSNVFRTTCLLVPLLIAASTVLAVAAVIDARRRELWHVVEGILLVVAAWIFARSKLSDHHAKWVEHRLTAELMRSSILCSLLHTVPQLVLPTERPEQWVCQSKVVWTYLRSLPLLPFSTPAADLLSARRSAIADYASYQDRFHRDFAGQHYAAQKWLIKISSRAYLATLCLVVVQLVIAYLPSASGGTVVKLMMGTLICTCGAFALSVLAHQLGFEAIAERSTNACQHFRDLGEAIDRGAPSADAQQVYAWARECSKFVLAEQHSWYRHIPLIRMHL